MLTHERVPHDPRVKPIIGLRDFFEKLTEEGELAAYDAAAPLYLQGKYGHEKSVSEILRLAAEIKPTVLLVTHPTLFGHDRDTIRRFMKAANDPVVLYLEGDAWGGRLMRPLSESMCAWLATADVVFTVSLGGQVDVLKKAGARDIRFAPQVFCHVMFAEAVSGALPETPIKHDVVVIASNHGRIAGLSRMPGVRGRYRLARRLQRQRSLDLALYGAGWKGRGARGLLPFPDQITAIREGLMSANWDHYPHYEGFASDRLPVSMLAGRAHVTTHHSGLEWLPGPEAGVFQERSVSAVVRRVRELAEAPREDVLARGAAAHEWARARLSTRELGRYMLSAVDERFSASLPSDPWRQVAEMRA